MKTALSIIAIVFVIGLGIFSGLSIDRKYGPGPADNGYLAWCDSIYHQNVGCPRHGKVTIPPEVLAEQEAELLEWWRESIYHQDVDCSKYGQVAISPEVLAEQEAEDLAWCENIYPPERRLPEVWVGGDLAVWVGGDPAEVLARQKAKHLEWCDSFGHRSISCPNFIPNSAR